MLVAQEDQTDSVLWRRMSWFTPTACERRYTDDTTFQRRGWHEIRATWDEFATFCSDWQGGTVRQSTSLQPRPLHRVSSTTTHVSHQRDPVSSEVVEKLIENAPNKYCQPDLAPAQHRQLLAPFITLLICTSLAVECFPVQFKHAVVTSLMKKGSSVSDSSQLKSYQLVSNLPFVSKLLEKAVGKQLQCYLIKSDLMPKHQSVYRQFHDSCHQSNEWSLDGDWPQSIVRSLSAGPDRCV